MANKNVEILMVAEVQACGLAFVGSSPKEQATKFPIYLLSKFRAHYGSAPADIAQVWYDVQTTTLGEPLAESDKSAKGFKMFMCAMYFLWMRPKNADLLCCQFKIGKRYIQSNKFWKWISKLSTLKDLKIEWDDRFSDNDYCIFVMSIDGVDFDIWEKPTNCYNLDKGLRSHKSNHGALQ